MTAVRRSGGGASMEHPADPGCAPYPSIWNAEAYREFSRDWAMQLAVFDQCRLGAPSRKPTGLASSSAE
eukprot:7142645-Alexandrium_andersonii.AAC.1